MKRQKMSRKLSTTYAILVVILVSTASVMFYKYNRDIIYNEGISNLNQVSASAMTQLDNRLTTMEEVAVDVLTNAAFMSNWQQYIEQQVKSAENVLNIKRILTRAYANKSDIRRVAVFSLEGDYIATGEANVTRTDVAQKVVYLQENFDTTNRVFISSHRDDWDTNSQTFVISEIKPIKNRKAEIIGFIEIQQNLFYIENICNLKYNNYYALKNDVVTIIATPDPRYVFTGWTSDNPSVVFEDATSPVTTFVMSECDVKITPNFAPSNDNDVSTMTDETFFGAWDGTTWTTTGKLDYSIAGLSAVEDAVKNGDYNLAKTELLSYYRNRTSVQLPDLGEPDRIGLLRAELEADNFFFTQWDETPLDVVTFTTTPSTVMANVTEGVNNVLQLTTDIGFMLMGRDHSDNSATISSRENADNKPVLVVTLEDNSQREFYPTKDAWINAGSGAAQNHGSDPVLKVREYGNENDTTKRSYIIFDLVTLGEKSVKSAYLKLHGYSDNGDYKVVVLNTGNLGFDENTLSWSSIEGTTYSWQGDESGTDWNRPAYSHIESAIVMARFNFLPEIAAAYLKTGDEYYASNAFRIWLDFIVDKGNSNPMYSRSIDSGIRLHNLIRVYNFLKDSPSLDPQANSAILKNLWQTAEMLSKPANFQSGNNHGVFETQGLFGFSLYFPEFIDVSKSGGWMDVSMSRLSFLASNLIRADGSYVEATTGYAAGVLADFTNIKRLGYLNNINFHAEFDTRLNQLVTYVMDFSRPDGVQAAFGDSDAEENFNGVLRSVVDVYPERTDLLYHITNGAQGTLPDHTSSFYPEGKSVFMKTGYTLDDMFMSIDLNSGVHRHPDLNTVTAYAYGRSLLTDPGVYVYGSSPITTWLQKTTEAHSTIEVDGKAQSNPTRSVVNGFSTNNIFDYYEGEHDGYRNNLHKRNVLFLRNKFWIVSDNLGNSDGKPHSYKQTWHYTPNANVTIDPVTGKAKSAYLTGANMQIIPADPSSFTGASVKSGYFSPYGGYYTYADYVAYEINDTTALTTFDTVLYPTREGEDPNVTVLRLPVGSSVPTHEATALQINLDDGNNGNIGYYYLNHKTPSGVMTFGTYSFDGKAVYIETDPSNRYVQAAIKDGSSLINGTTPVISSEKPISDMGVDWNGNVLHISGSLLTHSNNAEKAIAIYAPDVTSVTLNGKLVTFTRDGDYVYAAAAKEMRPEEVVASWEFDTDTEGWSDFLIDTSHVYFTDFGWRPDGSVGGHGNPTDDEWTEVVMVGPTSFSLSTADGNGRYVKIRMKQTSDSTLGGAVNYVAASRYRNVPFDNSNPDTDDYITYTVDMINGPNWGGNISKIVISLGMGTQPGDEFYVDYIRFQNTDKDYGRLFFDVTENGTIAADATFGNGARYAAKGDTVAVKATPDAGYVLARWECDNPAVEFDNPTAAETTFIMPEGDVRITALFTPLQSEAYTITASAGEHGSIDPEGEVIVDEGDSVTFTFEADEGYEIDKVIVDGEEIEVVGNSYTFENVTGNHSISVSFKAVEEPAKTYTITANAGEHGSIDPEGEVIVDEGDSVTFTFEPDEGYEIDKVIVDGEEIEVVGNSYTFEDVTGNHSINVSFKAVENPPGTTYPPPVTLPVEEPKVEDGKVEVPVPVVKEGVAVTEITVDIFTKALESVQKDATGVKTVVINIPEATGAQEYRQTLPEYVLTSDTADTKVEIVTDIAKLEVPGTNTGVKAETVSLSVSRVDKSALAPEVAAQVEDRPVIELNAYAGNEKVSWSNSDAPVKVTVKYVPENEEELMDSEFITIWYIDGSGNAVPVTNARYNAETGEITFKTTHFSIYAVVYTHKTFGDLEGYDWAKHSIEVMASKGIVHVTTDDSFSPSAKVTRADFLKFLMSTLDLHADFSDNFSDVDMDAYYYDAVGAAKVLGIVYGVGGNRFEPDMPITRQDMMVIVARALQMTKSQKEGTIDDLAVYADASLVSDYARESVAALVKAGIIQGANGQIMPLAHTTRAEAAAIMYRLYNR
jgi:hypothetical protein